MAPNKKQAVARIGYTHPARSPKNVRIDFRRSAAMASLNRGTVPPRKAPLLNAKMIYPNLLKSTDGASAWFIAINMAENPAALPTLIVVRNLRV